MVFIPITLLGYNRFTYASYNILFYSRNRILISEAFASFKY